MQVCKVVCDTNIISNFLSKEGKPYIKQKVLEIGLPNILITSVVYMELIRWLSVYKGFSIAERNKNRKFFDSLKVLHLNKEISANAMEIAKKVDSLDVADILIGTTAMYYDFPVFTENVKHFKLIKGIKLYDF